MMRSTQTLTCTIRIYFVRMRTCGQPQHATARARARARAHARAGCNPGAVSACAWQAPAFVRSCAREHIRERLVDDGPDLPPLHVDVRYLLRPLLPIWHGLRAVVTHPPGRPDDGRERGVTRLRGVRRPVRVCARQMHACAHVGRAPGQRAGDTAPRHGTGPVAHMLSWFGSHAWKPHARSEWGRRPHVYRQTRATLRCKQAVRACMHPPASTARVPRPTPACGTVRDPCGWQCARECVARRPARVRAGVGVHTVSGQARWCRHAHATHLAAAAPRPCRLHRRTGRRTGTPPPRSARPSNGPWAGTPRRTSTAWRWCRRCRGTRSADPRPPARWRQCKSCRWRKRLRSPPTGRPRPSPPACARRPRGGASPAGLWGASVAGRRSVSA